jgi:hypothetical protein
MADVLLSVIATFAALTFLFAALNFMRLKRIVVSEPLTKDMIEQLLRAETEHLRRSSDEQARGVQNTTISSFGS